MTKKGYTPEQIHQQAPRGRNSLKPGVTPVTVNKKIGVSVHTYYRWYKRYGAIRRRLRYLVNIPFFIVIYYQYIYFAMEN
jgi:hypothetical protein